jgi:hypothetical protein
MRKELLPPTQVTFRSINEPIQILGNILPKSATSNLDQREYLSILGKQQLVLCCSVIELHPFLQVSWKHIGITSSIYILFHWSFHWCNYVINRFQLSNVLLKLYLSSILHQLLETSFWQSDVQLVLGGLLRFSPGSVIPVAFNKQHILSN